MKNFSNRKKTNSSDRNHGAIVRDGICNLRRISQSAVQALLGRVRADLTKLLLFCSPNVKQRANDKARIISDYRTTSPATTLSFLKPGRIGFLVPSSRGATSLPTRSGAKFSQGASSWLANRFIFFRSVREYPATDAGDISSCHKFLMVFFWRNAMMKCG